MSSLWWSSHASASWPGVTSRSAAISRTRSTSSRFLSKFAPWKRGLLRRKSPSARSSGEAIAPDRKPRPSGRVGDEADAELAHGRQHRVLGVARPQRVLRLQRRDRVHGVRAADRLRRGLREPEVADLALLDQLLHRADRLLDRDGLVDAVLVVEVDVVDAEPRQRRVARAADVVGLAVDAEEAAVLAALVAELGREHDLVAAAGDRAADELLVGERAVHVGRVEEGDAELERALDRGDRLALVGGPVELGHPHAAEALGGNPQALAAKCSIVHATCLAGIGGPETARLAAMWAPD